MVGARVEVGLDVASATPRASRAGSPRRSAGPSRRRRCPSSVKPKSQQVVRVVAQPEVERRVLARDARGRSRGPGSTTTATSGATSASVAQALAREARVLERGEVRVRAERALLRRGRASSGRARRPGARSFGTGVSAASRPSKNVAHRLQRARVVARRLGVADADPEQEAVRVVGGDAARAPRRRRPARAARR